jgi:hypothetical protein
MPYTSLDPLCVRRKRSCNSEEEADSAKPIRTGALPPSRPCPLLSRRHFWASKTGLCASGSSTCKQPIRLLLPIICLANAAGLAGVSVCVCSVYAVHKVREITDMIFLFLENWKCSGSLKGAIQNLSIPSCQFLGQTRQNLAKKVCINVYYTERVS